MLMKQLLNVPGDFSRSLKLRRAVAIALLCVGAVGLICYFLLVPKSALPDFAQGFYLGASCGILLGALILLCRSQYLLTHPDAQKKVKIKEQDEREVTIKNQAFLLAGVVTFFASATALFVVLPLSMAAFRALLAAMVVYCLTFLGGAAYYSKKL